MTKGNKRFGNKMHKNDLSFPRLLRNLDNYLKTITEIYLQRNLELKLLDPTVSCASFVLRLLVH
jgi:hypothetical protein